MKREKADYTVQSVHKALEILEILADSDGHLDPADLCQRTGLPLATVHRILHTMEARGYVEEQPASGRFGIGLKSFEVGQAFRHQLGLSQAARPVLRDLVRACDESTSLTLLRGVHVVYLEVFQTSKALRIASRVGSITPAHCTAAGKIQLAFLPPRQLEQFLASPLKALTPRSLTDPEQIKRQLREAAERGYAMDDQEFDEGVRCIAVPIRDHHRHVIAGISITGPLSRMTDSRVRDELLPRLVEAGEEISRRLGCEPAREVS